jgi:fluoride exporter
MPDSWRDALLRSLWVALGGVLGANARYWFGGWIQARCGLGFPWGTLVVNLSGSLLMGLLLGLVAGRADHPGSATVRLAAGVGFLGAYTTFSTFSAESLALLEERRWAGAAGYALGSVVGGLAAAYAGLRLGRAM